MMKKSYVIKVSVKIHEIRADLKEACNECNECLTRVEMANAISWNFRYYFEVRYRGGRKIHLCKESIN